MAMTGAPVSGVFTLFFAVTPALACCTNYPYVFTFNTATQLFYANLNFQPGISNYVIRGLAPVPVIVQTGPPPSATPTVTATFTAVPTPSLSFGASPYPTAAATNTGTNTPAATVTPVATAR
jgi:hypothetical protein